jgi:hypothetical protein
VKIWVGDDDHDVPAGDVVPWLFGVNNSLDRVDLGSCRIEVDPAAYGRPGVRYLIEIDGKRRYLGEAWVLPWTRGLAVLHGMRPEEIVDPGAADRAQRVQALMVGHQCGWFTYHGFTHLNFE